MRNVILFGSTGHLGKEIAKALLHSGHHVAAMVRNGTKAKEMVELSHRQIIADVTNTKNLTGICNNFEIVVSALGKSVSPNDKSKSSFEDIDLNANSVILNKAVRSGLTKFVYVSALGAERYPHLEYFNTHHQFSEKLRQSGLGYSIIKPPALFSAFIDLMTMAKQGRLITLGKGDKLNNPIYEGDLATICVDAVDQQNAVAEAGGKEVLSRRQINEIIQSIVAPNKRVRRMPIGFVKASLPLMKIVSKNLYDKVAFFIEVMQHDFLAPKVGQTKLADYTKLKKTELFASQ